MLTYPLEWPDGVARTPTAQREPWPGEKAGLAMDLNRAVNALLHEVRRLHGHDARLTAGLAVRGGRKPEQARAGEPAVAAHFTLGRRARVIACDRYTSTLGNLRGIAKTIENLRGIERYGTGAMREGVWHVFDALPAPTPRRASAPRPWWEVLDVRRDASEIEIQAAFRRHAMHSHPDRGGSDDAMRELGAARAEGLRQRGAA